MKTMKTTDDFDWNTYTTKFYEKEMLNSDHNSIIENFNLNDDGIIYNDNLHPNHQELYYQIYRLKVKSIYECGFGPGQHLINNYKINENINIYGCEISQNQLDLGVKHFNINDYNFFNKLEIKDFSLPINKESNKYDFVYTQEVTMHLSYDKCIQFLKNMKSISNKYIFLIENFSVHNYDKIIKEVFVGYDKIMTSKYINYGILLKNNNDDE